MASKKTSKKKAAGSPEKDGPTIQQVDDPIIIKGGSISITFEGDTKFKKDNGNPKHKFDNVDGAVQLIQLVVKRKVGGKYVVIPGGRIPLQGEDEVVVYYA